MKDILETIIKQALNSVYNESPNLINANVGDYENVHNHEVAVVFRFGYYLIRLIDEMDILKHYHVDIEYNRNLHDIKLLKVQNRTKRIYPDLIVHKRGQKDNLLIIEFKSWWNRDQEYDKNKVSAFMDEEGPYAYKYGLLIKFEKENAVIEWIAS